MRASGTPGCGRRSGARCGKRDARVARRTPAIRVMLYGVAAWMSAVGAVQSRTRVPRSTNHSEGRDSRRRKACDDSRQRCDDWRPQSAVCSSRRSACSRPIRGCREVRLFVALPAGDSDCGVRRRRGTAKTRRSTRGIRYAPSRRALLGTYIVDFVAMVFGMPQTYGVSPKAVAKSKAVGKVKPRHMRSLPWQCTEPRVRPSER